MTALAYVGGTTTTATPLSEAVARPIRTHSYRTAELTDLHNAEWHECVVEQLKEVAELGDNWDGFRAGAIRRDVLSYACRVLDQIMLPRTPAPHITPMSHEGLMLEWHMKGIDLEIEIERPGTLWVSFRDHVEHIDEERNLESDLTMLATPIDKLTKRASIGN